MRDPKAELGWRAHEVEQRRARLKLTPLQRLLWLEDARRFATLALGAARRKRPPKSDAPR
jgi:hypothetical protein